MYVEELREFRESLSPKGYGNPEPSPIRQLGRCNDYRNHVRNNGRE